MAPCAAARLQASIGVVAAGNLCGRKGGALASALPSRIAGATVTGKIYPLRSGTRGDFPVLRALASAQPTVAVRNAEKSMQLPIDYYQILGAETHFSPDAVLRAYEARVSDSPSEGFSQEALRARQQILKVACDTLADRDLRDEYDRGLKDDEAGTLVVEVPWSKIPGALCLLQEVGEADVVVRVGEALLDENLKKPFKQDVALVTALAYVEMSREAMAESPPGVVRSCDMLNGALRLLQNEGNVLAPILQEQIYETLEEITPRCVLELLALPLDEEHKSQRLEGLQEARSILWTTGEGGLMARVGRFTREQFMKDALSRMTASEQVAFFTETPNTIPAEKLEVYSAALAHVAEGFKLKKPQLIQEGGNLFAQLQKSLNHRDVARSITDEKRDVILGRALCALLLGEVENCKTFLGLNDVNSPDRCPDIADFVFSNTNGNESDLLPGMCKLLESWLAEEVFANFRETADFQVSLSDYYDDPEVLAYLEKLEKGSAPLEAAEAIARLGEEATAALDSVRTTLGKVLTFRRAASHREKKTTKDQYDSSNESSLVTYDQDDSATKKSRPALLPLQIACIGALFLTGFTYTPLQQVLRSCCEVPFQSAVSSLLTFRKGKPEPKEILKMDARRAEQVIRNWQDAKAKALGRSRAISQLNEVLDGQMLKSWTERAVEIAKHGWYWEYTLLEINIDSVTISEDGRRATVEATLQEAAQLYDSNNAEHNNSYKSTYMTRYELRHGDDGWRITNGALLRS